MVRRPPVKAIIFDLGNVLFFYHDPTEWRQLAAFIGTGLKTMLPAYHRHFPAFQRGTITSREFIRRICRAVRRPVPPNAGAFFRTSINGIARKNTLLTALARTLRRRYKVAIVSNTCHDHRPYHNRHFPSRNFDYRFFSDRQGMVKPDPLVFRSVARKLGVHPSECLFTDDKAGHVAAAKGVGMRAVTFKSNAQCKKFLKRNRVQW